MTLGIYIKAPADQLDYDVLFDRWLVDGDSIQSATAMVEPADSMVSAFIPPDGVDGDTVKVWAIDGISGKTATVIVTATTVQNRVKQVKFQIRVRD